MHSPARDDQELLSFHLPVAGDIGEFRKVRHSIGLRLPFVREPIFWPSQRCIRVQSMLASLAAFDILS